MQKIIKMVEKDKSETLLEKVISEDYIRKKKYLLPLSMPDEIMDIHCTENK